MSKKETEIIEEPELPSVKVIPLGGLEQIGMNITAFEYDDSIIVVDCGIAFPEADMLGIDLVIPMNLMSKIVKELMVFLRVIIIVLMLQKDVYMDIKLFMS